MLPSKSVILAAVRKPAVLLLAATPAAILLAGCAGLTPVPEAPVETRAETPLGTITGEVFGGRAPISGATITVYQANTTGNGGPGIAASASNASISKGSTTTGSDGTFTLTGNYTCSSGSSVYIVSTGGNPGGGTNNAAGLMAVLGTCPSTSTFASTVPAVYMNEVSTAAAAFAFAQYASDATHISSDGTALAVTGITNAFNNAALLYDIGSSVNATGGATARATTASGGTVPQQLLNSLANSLAACVNSVNATACSNLFTYTNQSGAPTETATAAIRIAQYPSTQVSNIFNLPAGITPYGNHLSSAPSDFSVGIQYTAGGSLRSPFDVAIDASGNAFFANDVTAGSITKFTPAGVYSTLPANGLNNPAQLAFDPQGNLWVTNVSSAGMKYYDSTLTPRTVTSDPGSVLSYLTIDNAGYIYAMVSGSNPITVHYYSAGPMYGGGYTVTSPSQSPRGIAEDGEEGQWFSYGNGGTGHVVYDDYNGTVHAAPGSYVGTGPIAIDSAGTAWVIDAGGSLPYGYSALDKITNSGPPNYTLTTTQYANTFADGAVSVAIDGNGNVILANGGSITKYPPTGGLGGGVFAGGSQSGGYALAIDGSGDVWLPNEGTNSVTELIGLVAPVITPLSAALPAGATISGSSSVASRLGTRP